MGPDAVAAMGCDGPAGVGATRIGRGAEGESVGGRAQDLGAHEVRFPGLDEREASEGSRSWKGLARVAMERARLGDAELDRAPILTKLGEHTPAGTHGRRFTVCVAGAGANAHVIAHGEEQRHVAGETGEAHRRPPGFRGEHFALDPSEELTRRGARVDEANEREPAALGELRYRCSPFEKSERLALTRSVENGGDGPLDRQLAMDRSLVEIASDRLLVDGRARHERRSSQRRRTADVVRDGPPLNRTPA